MLGWAVTVYRQSEGGDRPAAFESKGGVELAVWQANVHGLTWLEELASAGKAIHLGGSGYPYRFTGRAEDLLPFAENPPDANRVWLRDEFDVVFDSWVGKTRINRAAIEQCRPEEWLLVEAWDES